MACGCSSITIVMTGDAAIECKCALTEPLAQVPVMFHNRASQRGSSSLDFNMLFSIFYLFPMLLCFSFLSLINQFSSLHPCYTFYFFLLLFYFHSARNTLNQPKTKEGTHTAKVRLLMMVLQYWLPGGQAHSGRLQQAIYSLTHRSHPTDPPWLSTIGYTIFPGIA